MSFSVASSCIQADGNTNRTANSLTNSPNISVKEGKRFSFPEFWYDDDRMQAFMCAFREREVNVRLYDAKMEFWMEMIRTYCLFKGEAHFSHNELRKSFARSNELPNCLNEVLMEMCRQKSIRNRLEYEYDPTNSWRGWAANCLLRRPLGFVVHKLKTSLGFADADFADFQQYVHIEAMQTFCRELEGQVLQTLKGKILHCNAFYEVVAKAGISLTKACLDMCLHTLNSLGKIGIERIKEDGNERIHLIKIPTKRDSDITITSTDHAVHNLDITYKSLLQKMDSLEAEILGNQQKARHCLLEGKRLMAKTYLRRKRTLESRHEKLSVALVNIDELLRSVDEALSNGVILDSYKIGSEALQNALKESGLTYDNAHEVIMDIKDAVDQHVEVQDLISASTLMDDSLNSDELDKELLQLCNVAPRSQKKEPVSVPLPSPVTQSNAVNTEEITDKQLLAMIEALEVEDTSLNQSTAEKPSMLLM